MKRVGELIASDRRPLALRATKVAHERAWQLMDTFGLELDVVNPTKGWRSVQQFSMTRVPPMHQPIIKRGLWNQWELIASKCKTNQCSLLVESLDRASHP